MERSTDTRGRPPVVRITWLKFLLYCWKQISQLGKIFIYIFVLFNLLQVAFAFTVLIQSSHEQCERPLRVYVMVHALRAALICPLLVPYFVEIAEKRSRQIYICSAARRFVILAEKTLPWMESLTLIWFAFGNYLAFSSSACIHDAPRLYFGTLSFILVDYLLVLGAFSVCISTVLCLPFGLRFINNDNRSEQEMRKEDISRISVYKYKWDQVEVSQPLKNIKRQSWFQNSRLSQGDIEAEGYETVTLEVDVVCCICLSDYKENDILCKLQCEHYFHRICITDWLMISRECPLCKQDFKEEHYGEACSGNMGNIITSSH
ncbi:hypothetical protein G6F56_003887 [Rhizopus delemar]|nr:hypothetical protein G6F56_003887 [Rhizopus delemar]